MVIKVDPENNEIDALCNLTNFRGLHVLEIGCGDGRLTWRYAGKTEHVTAIDPFAEGISRARKNLQDDLRSRVDFHQITFNDFAVVCEPSSFDLVILSWSL